MSINLKNLSRITFRFAPLDPGHSCRSIREFLARCTTPKVEATNPKCEIDVRVRKAGAPWVEVIFAAGQREKIYTAEKKVQEILDVIEQKTQEADTAETLKEAGFDPNEKLFSDWNC